MKKRILSILLLCCMVLTLLPTAAFAAGELPDVKLSVPTTFDKTVDLTKQNGELKIKDSKTYLIKGSTDPNWYFQHRIKIDGKNNTPHIFLDGVRLQAPKDGPAIELYGGASACLYFIGGDSELIGAENFAALQKNKTDGYLRVLVQTGTKLTCEGGRYGAGIGGSKVGIKKFSQGHGMNLHFGSLATGIYGGEILATSGVYGAGIGGGQGGVGERIYVYSGKLTVRSVSEGAGIGGGQGGPGRFIYIKGGTVNAGSESGGAGIGSGDQDGQNKSEDAHHIEISGGTVEAWSNYAGAGIGGGRGGSGYDISITGGVVRAQGYYGAGIGGGMNGDSGNILIKDTTLTALAFPLYPSSDYTERSASAVGRGSNWVHYMTVIQDQEFAMTREENIKIEASDGKSVRLSATGWQWRPNQGTNKLGWGTTTELLIGCVDLQRLSLPYAYNYGRVISELELRCEESTCSHEFGWAIRDDCHIWACKKCGARDPAAEMSKQNGKHIPGVWRNQEQLCAVCGHVIERDTKAPVMETLTDGESYTVEDTPDGKPGAYTFTVSDPAASGETSSGVKSVTINGEPQDGPTYRLPAPDGGNNDAGAEYTVVATDNAGNETTATVRTYRRHHEHNYGDWSKDGTSHWHECTDYDCPNRNESIKDNAAHDYTDDADTTCNVCGYERTVTPPAPAEHTVTVTNDGNGTASASLAKAAAGTEITLTATPANGYHFKEWQVESPAGLVITNNKFTMPDSNVAIKAIFEEDSPFAPTRHTVTVKTDGNGIAFASPLLAEAGTEITLTATPNTGYHFKEWQVISGNVTIKDDKFLMPDSNVEVKAIFEEDAPPAPTEHTVTVTSSGNGTASASPAKAVAGAEITLSATPDKGYHLKEWQVISGGVSIKDNKFTMPNNNVEIKAIFEKDAPPTPTEYTVTVTTEGGGTASASPAKAAAGTEITLTATPNTGYHFKEWQVISGNVTIKDDKFLMPDSNVEIKAIFEKDAPPTPTEYTVTVTSSGNGTASASPSKAVAGAEITLSATPDKGYHLKEWQVESPTGLVITNNKFTMPDSNVEVKAIFEEDAPPAPTDPAKPSISVTGAYTYNGSVHTATVSGYDPATMDISGNTATDAGDYTVRVTSKTGKWADGSTDAVTAAWSIGKATQEAPIGLIGVAPSTEDGSDGKITGVTDKMEYRMAGESIYTACSGTEIENLSAGNYFVRYAEDNNHFAGTDAEVTVGKGAPLADCTITFDGNGGSGSMGPVTVKAGANYILPECGFTAPADQEFKAWEIGGTEYKVGDSYTVLVDTEIKALWENSVITPTTYTVTVGNDGNGTGTATPSTAAAGTTITLTATPNKGYHFKEWQVISGGVSIKDNKFTMPNNNVEIKAIFEKDAPPTPTEYTVTVTTEGGGTASASPAKAAAGTEITLTATPNTGYHFKEWQVISGGVTIKDNKFLMPSANVEVKAIFEKDAPPAPTEFTITVTSGDNGTASASHAKAVVGTEITLTATPNKGYHFKEWQVISGGVTIKDDKFTMPSANVEVKAIFEKDTGGGGGGYNPPVTYYTLRFETGGGSDIPSVREAYNTYIDLTKYVPTWRGHTFIGWYTERSLMNKVSGVYLTKDMTVYAGWRVDENPNTGANPFTDVSEKDWFYGDVMFVYENGLMLGTSKTLFSPHGTATRGMMATILWRMEGSPAPKGKNSFTDVEAGKWYADAITWTAENGIFAGYGKDKFGPDDPITREQLAAIFYRYADYKGYDLTVKGNLDKFKDADKITDYAKTAMQWAVGSGLVKGKSGNLLDPQGTATRAEIAAMLHRFIEKYELVQGKAPGGLMGWIDPKRLQIPKTGDSSVLGLWGISLCTSLAGCLVLTTWQIRRRREEEALQIIEK